MIIVENFYSFHFNLHSDFSFFFLIFKGVCILQSWGGLFDLGKDTGNTYRLDRDTYSVLLVFTSAPCTLESVIEASSSAELKVNKQTRNREGGRSD